MKRITFTLMDGSRISIVTDEIRCVSVGHASLGPARLTLHPSGLEDATSYACADLWCAALRACQGQDIVDGPPVCPGVPSIALEGKEARAEDDQGHDDDDENPGPSSRVRACVFCGEGEHENASTCPGLTYTRG